MDGDMARLSPDELAAVGFQAVGRDVQISEHATFYGASRISLGNGCRIDDFSVLSAGTGGIRIGRNVHISCRVTLIGAGAIVIGDFTGVSAGCSVFSSSDDYSGEWMACPTVPPEFTNVDVRPITIGRHCLVGAGSVVLPGVVIGEGAVVGALSLVREDCETFGVYVGQPARRVGERKRGLLRHEENFLAKHQ